MTFPPQFLDEIRARVPLEGTIARRVRLQRRGRESIGLCPFHKEKTPSFTVNEDKGFFHCFGCGAHGDVIGFVMRDEGLSFPEAVERLAADAGLALPARDPQAAARERERHSLYEVVETAAAWFEAELAGPRGETARRYLEGRGVDGETRATFRLGYAPDSRNALRVALGAGGVTEAMMLEAGLVIAPEGGGTPYDRFRGRVIFPICDRRGRVVAFGGRALGEAKAKYLNSPETALFSKGTLLYGQHLAAPAARKAGRAIAVEGYMDVIALHRAGIAEAVAPLGTALTEQQLEALWRLAEDPVLCFDGDEAGKRAAARAVERALPLLSAGRTLRFAALPAGQDPDTMVRDGGPRAMADIVDAANSLFQQLGKMAADGRPLDSPEARKRAHTRFRDLVSRVSDADLRNDYRDAYREQLWPSSRDRRRGSRPAPDAVEPKVSPGALRAPGGGGTAQPRERTLLQTLLDFPALVLEQQEALAALHLETPRFAAALSALTEWAEAGPDPEQANLRDTLAGLGHGGVVDEIANSNTHYLDRVASLADARTLLGHILEMRRRSVELPAALAEAGQAHGDEANWEPYRQTIRHEQDLGAVEAEVPDYGGPPRTGRA